MTNELKQALKDWVRELASKNRLLKTNVPNLLRAVNTGLIAPAPGATEELARDLEQVQREHRQIQLAIGYLAAMGADVSDPQAAMAKIAGVGGLRYEEIVEYLDSLVNEPGLSVEERASRLAAKTSLSQLLQANQVYEQDGGAGFRSAVFGQPTVEVPAGSEPTTWVSQNGGNDITMPQLKEVLAEIRTEGW